MYRCKGCDKSISDAELAEQMVSGCQNCGNRVFRIAKSDNNDISKEKLSKTVKDSISDEIAIRVSDKGTYNVNLEALIKRQSGIEPILIQDRKGKVNVILNPDPSP